MCSCGRGCCSHLSSILTDIFIILFQIFMINHVTMTEKIKYWNETVAQKCAYKTIIITDTKNGRNARVNWKHPQTWNSSAAYGLYYYNVNMQEDAHIRWSWEKACPAYGCQRPVQLISSAPGSVNWSGVVPRQNKILQYQRDSRSTVTYTCSTLYLLVL